MVLIDQDRNESKQNQKANYLAQVDHIISTKFRTIYTVLVDWLKLTVNVIGPQV